MSTLAADYLEKRWQHCLVVLRKFSWIFSFPSLEFFQDLGGSPYPGISSPSITWKAPLGKISRRRKKKFFEGSANKFLLSANGFSRIKNKWSKKIKNKEF
jgi:hypothetical protein